MAKIFVFLEFNDPEIKSFLSELRHIISNGGNASDQVHITLRGPFKKARPKHMLESFEACLNDEPILISGVGRFYANEKCVVYLKVSSPYLKKVWYKPDYPIRKYGFNPHITLYEGFRESGDKVYEFLLKEDISLLSFDYSVTQYFSKNMSLFSRSIQRYSEKDFRKLIVHSRIKSGILDRAKNLASELHLVSKPHLAKQQELWVVEQNRA